MGRRVVLKICWARSGTSRCPSPVAGPMSPEELLVLEVTQIGDELWPLKNRRCDSTPT
jgi:hypothetical protein